MSSPARHSREKSSGHHHHHHHHHSHHHHQKTDFSSTIKKWSSPVPPVLLRKIGRANDSPLGKVKVMLKVCEAGEDLGRTGILGIDQRKKQVTLVDPRGVSTGLMPEERRVDVSAPKMFAFDGIFGADDDQAEVCAAAGPDLIASVIGGEDGSLVALGSHASGKRQSMFGRPQNQKMGIVPTAIAWLFKCLQEQREKTGSRFSLRVSAAEIAGSPSNEAVLDLLLPFSTDKPDGKGQELLENHARSGSKSATAVVLDTLTELTVASLEHAGFYLDAVLDGMSKDDPSRHAIFTVHMYRYDKNGHGAAVETRSRLHFVMLGSGSPSLSVLGGLLLAVLNGQRHLPSRGSKIGSILRECIGSLTCRAVIMIHVSDAHSKYAETLAALQLGSRVHRLRRSRRLKMGSVSSGNGSGGSSGGSGEEMRIPSTCITSRSLSGVGEVAETGNSDIDPSSSEQSCDTVIYLGPSLDDATDGEHPPVYLPLLDAPLSTKRNSNEKCALSPHPPKTRSPKPRSGKTSGSEFSCSGKSEEQWVDGPKVPKYRQLASTNGARNAKNNNTKKSETWIDGPAARVQHQASNFPSPKKIPNPPPKLQHQSRDYSDISLSPSSIVSTKTEMIHKWISNQTHTLLNEPPSDSVECPTLPLYVPVPHEMRPLYSDGGYRFDFHPPPSNNFLNGTEPEYKQMTVFKTCDDSSDSYDDHLLCAMGTHLDNDFEFEIIEVEDPEVPVPTEDVCIQVTEEDIAQSYQELEENPLPESDQCYSMSGGNHSRVHPKRRNGSLFGPDPFDDLAGKNEDHPLRALSEECLVVSTFPDSVQGEDDESPPFCPHRFSFDVSDFHNEQTCNGLCKHLVTLSHMSLNHPTIKRDPFKEAP